MEKNAVERLGEFGDDVMGEKTVSGVEMRNGDVVIEMRKAASRADMRIGVVMIELVKVERPREMSGERMFGWIQAKRNKGFGEDAVIVMMMVTGRT